MVINPVHVPRKSYRGAKLVVRQRVADLNRFAETMEHWLNAQIDEHDGPV